jgi:hypothetical protein
MSGSVWVAVGTLVVVVVWLGLALVGAVRELGTLRGRVDALEAAGTPTTYLETGLAVGAPAPAWTIATSGGGVASSSAFDGRRHLLVFADATCRACEDLVPAVITAASGGTVPPLAVIGRGDAASTPGPWRAADVRVRIGSEPGDEVSEAYRVDVSPFVFVIDEGGSVVARGGAATLDDVLALVREAEGVRIVAAGGA